VEVGGNEVDHVLADSGQMETFHQIQQQSGVSITTQKVDV